MNEQHSNGIDRRGFMKAAGTVAGASLIGVGTAAGAEASGFDGTFANWRVREAKKVWDRGYRGRPDRTLGLTDSGIDARHPDLGPWNGVQATTNDGELVLTGPDLDERSRATLDGETVTRSGTAGPGSFATGSEVPTEPFQPPGAADELDAVLSWTPTEPANDLELRLDVKVGEEQWEEVATAATANETEQLNGVQIEPDETYRFVAEQYATVSCTFEIVGTFYEYEGQLGTYDESEVFAFLDDDGGPQPKTVGWFNETARYGTLDYPNDPDGHGSHCSSIMGGSGRASAVEVAEQDEPRAVLTAGDTLEYQVDADAGTGVFISAYGTGIELVVEGPDGRQLDSSVVGVGDTSVHENNVAEAPAEQTGTYTLYVRAAGGEIASTARCQRVAYGRFHEPDATDGDRSDGEPALHSGMAPDASLVGLQGLSDPTVSLGEYAEEFSRIFNMRAVNMSWGYVGGLPLGAFGGQLGGDIVTAVKQISDGGILTVAAAGNAATPANGNGAPGIADESISVAATDHSDGLVAYSSGGIGGQDEDGEGEYMKPDVSAPGGSLTDLVNAVLAVSPDVSEDDVPIRDYTGKAGTSMASPYTTGTAGLVAEAMEFDAPEAIALPTPERTDLDDVLRLKQVILATASETVFTAAPFHRAHAPTYQGGGRDPYEGFGRINPDAAVDAVSRTLVDGTGVAPTETASFSDLASVGLNLPEDSRAVAGHVVAPDGTIDASIEFSHYSGGNEGMTKENPHLDLFVYDAESPAANGEPNIVASAQAVQGSGSVSVDVSSDDSDVYYVVAKIVDVPGVVNGYDVQANFDLGVDYTAAQLPALSVSGSRADDGSVFTAGQTDQVDVTVTGISSQVPDDALVRLTDQLPEAWSLTGFGDVERRDGTTLDFGTVTAGELRDGISKKYFAEAPDSTGQYTFGPASVELVDGPVDGLRGTEASFGGTDTNNVVGVDQNTASTDSL